MNMCNCTAVTRSQIVRLHNRFTALAKNDERHLTYVCNLLTFVYFSSVKFSYRIYVSRSLIIKIMKAVLTRSNYEEAFQFSAG